MVYYHIQEEDCLCKNYLIVISDNPCIELCIKDLYGNILIYFYITLMIKKPQHCIY